MVAFLVVVALLMILSGFGVLAGAKSAIHEILGTLAIGFSMLMFGLAAVVIAVKRVERQIERLVRAVGADRPD